MKILFEVPARAGQNNKSSFSWLNNANNWLCLVQDGKRIGIVGSQEEPAGRELHSIALTEPRCCTSLSWNRDGSIVGLVVDKRLIYFWSIGTNQLSQFKPKCQSDAHYQSSKPLKVRDIDQIAWSSVSNKLALCYSSGQIMLCDFDSGPSECFIDNSKGVLKRITSIESLKAQDCFICITVMYEILLATFDAEIRLYVQLEHCYPGCLKLSPAFGLDVGRSRVGERHLKDSCVWLAYQVSLDELHFKLSAIDNFHLHEQSAGHLQQELNHSQPGEQIVDFYWLSASSAITCYASGLVILVCIEERKSLAGEESREHASCSDTFAISTETILNAGLEIHGDLGDGNGQVKLPVKRFVLRNRQANQSKLKSYSLAAMTDYGLYYYDLFEDGASASYSAESVDQLELADSLKKLRLVLSRLDWSLDCSMLAVELANGHILVYRTSLSNQMLASGGPKIAYLSGPTEITVLNYRPGLGPSASQEELENSVARNKNGADDDDMDQRSRLSSSPANNNALTLAIQLRPSVIAVGGRHLAVALNNRVSFYRICSAAANADCNLDSRAQLVSEQEYVGVVRAMRLNSRYVAVQFSDARLKLHAIESGRPSAEARVGPSEPPVAGRRPKQRPTPAWAQHERFFPDPSRPERIGAFALTESLFVYATRELRLHLFRLDDWSDLEPFEHASVLPRPISAIRANECGNRFACLAAGQARVYDLITNSMVDFEARDAFRDTLRNQAACLSGQRLWPNPERGGQARARRFEHALEALWDTDGRTVMIVEQRRMHGFACLDCSLAGQERPLLEYVLSVDKPFTYSPLYVSQGIVSYQTRLGRVVNSIMEAYDDESRLARLAADIDAIRRQSADLAAQLRVAELKLELLVAGLGMYSLARCVDLCEHLCADEQLNFPRKLRLRWTDECLWRLLVCRAVFVMNIGLASALARRHSMPAQARALDQLRLDLSLNRLGSKRAVADRLREVLS